MLTQTRDSDYWSGQKIFITGGAGFLGSHIIEALYDKCDFVVYSRDEAKHYYLKKRFPKIKTVIGDVRDFDLMKRASKGCHRGVYAASLKQIEACDENPEEANKVIIEGAFNSRRVTEENGMLSGVFISTDKSRAATTIYGAMKFVAGESFVLNMQDNGPSLSTLVYGNVMASTGSVIPLIWSSIKNNIKLKLYGEDMTRFMITVQDAVNLVISHDMYSGYTICPKLRSFKVKDLFEIYSRFGLKYEIAEPRVGEKIHEIMVAPEEIPRVKYIDESSSFAHTPIFLIHPKKLGNQQFSFPNGEFSSRDFCIPKEVLDQKLKSFDYFKS